MQYSVVNKQYLDKIIFRLDAEYYRPGLIALEKQIAARPNITLRNANAKLDCSAFYPSIVPFYNFQKQGIPFLRVNEIQNGLINISADTVFLPKNILQENASTIAKARPNDIVIAKGGNSLAKVALLTDDYPEYAICRDLIVLKTASLTSLNLHYLWMFLHSSIGQQFLLRTASQTGQPHLTVEAIYELSAPLLSDSTQDIFERLYVEAQSLQKKSLTNYEKAEQILLSLLGLLNWTPKHRNFFVKNFTDTQRVARLDAEYFQPMYEEIVRAVFSSKDHSFLGDLVSVKKCVEPGSAAYHDNGVMFLRVSNLSKFGFKDGNQQYISEDLYDALKKHQPMQGEILLSKDATPGIAYYLKNGTGKMIPSGGILRLKVKDESKLCSEYLTLVLNSVIVQKQIERDAGGSIIDHWLVDQVKNTLIPVLPIAEQMKIAEMVKESFCNRELSKKILDIAKVGVGTAIEKSEKDAQGWIDLKIKELEIK